MLTKSKIQILNETIEYAGRYKDSIINLMERYNIEDSIFVYKNDQLFEATQGYFEVTNTFANINEAIHACWGGFDQLGIRIINNSEFQVGYIKKYLSECTDGATILCIDTLSEVC